MKVKDFFESVTSALNIDFSNKEESKKRALKKLLAQLKEDKEKLEKVLKRKDLDPERREEIKEELKIYSIHIKKGKEVLNKKLAKNRKISC